MRFYYLIRVLSTQYQVSTGNEPCVPELHGMVTFLL